MISILSSQSSPRLQYTLDFVFREIFSENFEVVHYAEDIHPDSRLIIVYQKRNASWSSDVQNFIIPEHGFLFENNIQNLTPSVQKSEQGLPYFFESSPGEKVDINFDIFSFTFYLISRYEEYTNPAKDRFGRFPAKSSFAYNNGFLEKPLVDLWLHHFSHLVHKKTGYSLQKNPHFAVYPSIDVDKVWAFAYPESRAWKGWIKDIVLLRFSVVRDRLKSLQNPETDPFFSFSFLQQCLAKSGKKALYFILYSKNPDSLDINHKRQLAAFQDWLKSFSLQNNIGIHPSWFSNQSATHVEEEKLALSASIKKPVFISRQHYILLSFPQTFQNLIAAGITDDYSLGYPDHIGFRASTGQSYYWFDLTKNAATSLRLHPFQIMDVTLKKYMSLDPEQSIVLCNRMIQEAKQSNTPIRFIWHNSSFYSAYGWEKWENVFSFLCDSDNFS